MAINPSNNVPDGFPTVGDPPFSSGGRDAAMAELEAAGFPRGSTIVISNEVQVWKKGTDVQKAASAGIHIPGMGKEEDKEWIQVYSVEARLFGWKFKRLWYYWDADAHQGDRIPIEEADRLYKALGKVLRVDGIAGGREPNGPVEGYHIDRPDALLALVESLKKANGERLRAERNRQARGSLQ